MIWAIPLSLLVIRSLTPSVLFGSICRLSNHFFALPNTVLTPDGTSGFPSILVGLLGCAVPGAGGHLRDPRYADTPHLDPPVPLGTPALEGAP
jgi:hypothetical protein